MDLFTDKQLLFNIVINTDIEDLYILFETNHFIKAFLNEKYTLTSIAEKYHIDYQENFIDIVWDYIINKINILTHFKYKNVLSGIQKSLHIKLITYYFNNDFTSDPPRTPYVLFAVDQRTILRREHPDMSFVDVMNYTAEKWRDEDIRNYYRIKHIKNIFGYAKYLSAESPSSTGT